MIIPGYGEKLIKASDSECHEDTVQVIEIDKNPDTGIFATGGWDGVVKIWEVQDNSNISTTNQKIALKINLQFEEMVLSLAFHKSYALFVGLSNG